MSSIADVGRVLRTVRHFRLRQGAAVLRHAFAGPIRPRQLDRSAPELAVARVGVPFLAPPSHAHLVERSEHLSVQLVNREVVFREGIDWDYAGEGPLWAYHLHQFDYIRCSDVSAATRAALILDWIDHHRGGIGWSAHPISLRLLCWGKLLLSADSLPAEREDELCERMRASLASQLETLARNPEVRLQANHLLTNLLATVFGGLLFAGSDADRWLEATSALDRELALQILPDGMHEERSPMYHLLLLEQILDLLNLARAADARAPEGLAARLADYAARMLAAVEVVTHPDGEIALFADSGLGIAQRPGVLADYARALGVQPSSERATYLPEAGFVALSAGDLRAIVTLSEPLPSHQPGHAHCDALSFELSVGEERVVADTGVFEYLPGELRDASRTTASHATVMVDGREQAELWAAHPNGAHRIGARPRVEVTALEPGLRVEATCCGYATPDTVHRRAFGVKDRVLTVRDAIEGRLRPVRFALPLAPNLSARLHGEPGGARRLHVSLPDGRVLRIDLPGAGEVDWRLDRRPYFPEFGLSLERWCLVGHAQRFRAGEWRFELLEPTAR